MKNQNVEGEIVEPVDSLSQALEKVRPVYSGHPADSSEEVEDTNTGEQVAGEVEGDTQEKPGNEPDVSDKDSPKFKHKSWDETEKARLEAERWGHQKAEEAKREREAREALERQLEQEKLDRADKTAQVEQTPQEPQHKEAVGSYAKRFLELDQYADDYQEKAAALLTEMVTAAVPQAGQADIKTVVQQEVESRINAREEAKNVVTRKQAAHDRAVQLAAKEGLNMEPESVDSILFWSLSDKVPQDLPFDEQVKAVTSMVKEKKTAVIKTELETKAKNTQRENAVLERGTSAAVHVQQQQGKSDAPLTLGEAINRTLRERRV